MRNQCPTCADTKDVRATQCRTCQTRLNPSRRGTGVRVDGFSLGKRGYFVKRINGRLQYEHRLVMEAAIGRPLQVNEHVHHKNGIKTDNRVENLEILDAAEHHRGHMSFERAKEMSILGHNARWGT